VAGFRLICASSWQDKGANSHAKRDGSRGDAFSGGPKAIIPQYDRHDQLHGTNRSILNFGLVQRNGPVAIARQGQKQCSQSGICIASCELPLDDHLLPRFGQGRSRASDSVAGSCQVAAPLKHSGRAPARACRCKSTTLEECRSSVENECERDSDAYKRDYDANIDQKRHGASARFESQLSPGRQVFGAERQRRDRSQSRERLPSPPLLTVRTRATPDFVQGFRRASGFPRFDRPRSRPPGNA